MPVGMLSHVSERVHRDESRSALRARPHPPADGPAQVGGGSTRARATLEIERDARAPQGELSAADGLRIGFVGWTELASAIERWREHLSARHGRAVGVEASQGARDVETG
jgi:hypothetical protein